MPQQTSAPKKKRWTVPLKKTTRLTPGERRLAEIDKRLQHRATKNIAPTDARFSEQLRCAAERMRPDTSVDDVSAFTALELSFELQTMAARLFEHEDEGEAANDRRRIAAIWKVANDLNVVRKEASDPRAVMLRLVDVAREEEEGLDLDQQMRLVVRGLARLDSDFARRIDPDLLRRLLLAWNPTRGRPKAGAPKPEDPWAIGVELVYRATNVKTAPGALRKLWERARSHLRVRL